MNYIKKIKENSNIKDLLCKEIIIGKQKIDIITIETIANNFNINEFILKKIDILKQKKNLYQYLLNNLPCINIKEVYNYEEIINLLVNAYTIIVVNEKILAVETINFPQRSVSECNYEKSVTGPKDSFIENFNTNVGLIRKRIKSIDLKLDTLTIGKYSNTTIGMMYLDRVSKKGIRIKIMNKLKKINIDGLIDSGTLKKYLTNNYSLFPTIKTSERPDIIALALLEGKIIILVDNSPNVLILPSFFVDFFHTSDDYYSKKINVSFIRIIRLIAFIIAIITPSYYISITTYNTNFIPIPLLINLISQRNSVPFPSFIEALILIISFEILREGDARIPSNQGSAISILGGLILGEAAVSAGIVSPIMIIIVAISIISSLLFQSIEVVNAIRWWRLILIILSSLLGFYGIFIGTFLIIINLSSVENFDIDYLYPFAPINFKEQKDGFIKIDKGKKYRNPFLSNNLYRGE